MAKGETPAEKYREFEVTIRYRLEDQWCRDANFGTITSERDLWREISQNHELLHPAVKVRRLK